MRNRHIVSVGAGKCSVYPHCRWCSTNCYTLEIWNCSCRIYRKHGRLQIQPCDRSHCPVFGNLCAGANPVHVQMRLEKRV